VSASATGNNATMTAGPDPEVIDGRYVLDAVIGRGAMAEVRSGEDLRLRRAVAVKLLHESLASQDDARLRFEEEARAAARLSDPNVVAIHDTGEHRGRPYIVMELLPGRTLRDELGDGPLSEDRAREVIIHVLSALHAAHSAGVIHRDIKPANILLTETGEAKVADFGIAKVAESSDLTATGLLLGTPSYLAPECVTGHAATAASDLYAVGVVLYEALSGARPFAGNTPLAVCHAIMSEEPTPLRELCPDVSDDLIAVVTRAMARDPKARFRNSDDMIRAIEGEPVPLLVPVNASTQPIESTQATESEATVVSPMLRTEVLAPPHSPDATQMFDRPGPPGRRGGIRRSVVALIVVAAALILVAALTSGNHGIDSTGITTTSIRTRPTVTVPTTATTLPTTQPTKPGKKGGDEHGKPGKPGED
jgi:serine/threonine protein kinase